MEMDLSTYLEVRRKRINQTLEALLPPVNTLQKTVVEAMRYSLLAGGKRIRPILCLAGAEAVGGDTEDILSFACAIEMIHAYSLIHDDLPAMDDDDFRRGQPTNHKKFGEAAAILAGDGLLTEAFAVMTRRSLHPGVDPANLLEATELLAREAGFRGMVGGQIVDMEAENTQPSLEVVDFMHAAKTAALIRASVASGAILAGGDPVSVSALSEYGHCLGIAFQIRDDLLDVLGDSREMGKPAGSDVQRNKATYPAVLGTEESERRERRTVELALNAIAEMDAGSDPLRAIAQYLLTRNK